MLSLPLGGPPVNYKIIIHNNSLNSKDYSTALHPVLPLL